jgi:hypothetical protein
MLIAWMLDWQTALDSCSFSRTFASISVSNYSFRRAFVELWCAFEQTLPTAFTTSTLVQYCAFSSFQVQHLFPVPVICAVLFAVKIIPSGRCR